MFMLSTPLYAGQGSKLYQAQTSGVNGHCRLPTTQAEKDSPAGRMLRGPDALQSISPESPHRHIRYPCRRESHRRYARPGHERFQQARQINSRRFPFDRRISGDDDFLDSPNLDPINQFIHPDVRRPDAVKRREDPEKYVIEASISAGSFNRIERTWLLHD